MWSRHADIFFGYSPYSIYVPGRISASINMLKLAEWPCFLKFSLFFLWISQGESVDFQNILCWILVENQNIQNILCGIFWKSKYSKNLGYSKFHRITLNILIFNKYSTAVYFEYLPFPPVYDFINLPTQNRVSVQRIVIIVLNSVWIRQLFYSITGGKCWFSKYTVLNTCWKSEYSKHFVRNILKIKVFKKFGIFKILHRITLNILIFNKYSTAVYLEYLPFPSVSCPIIRMSKNTSKPPQRKMQYL